MGSCFCSEAARPPRRPTGLLRSCKMARTDLTRHRHVSTRSDTCFAQVSRGCHGSYDLRRELGAAPSCLTSAAHAGPVGKRVRGCISRGRKTGGSRVLQWAEEAPGPHSHPPPLLHARPLVGHAFQDHRPPWNQKMLPEVLEGRAAEPRHRSLRPHVWNPNMVVPRFLFKSKTEQPHVQRS